MTLETARANGVDFVVLDTPARSEGAALARASDLVIIPCRPRDFLESLAVPVCLQTIGQRVTFGNAGTLGLSPLRSATEGSLLPLIMNVRFSSSIAPRTGKPCRRCVKARKLCYIHSHQAKTASLRKARAARSAHKTPPKTKPAFQEKLKATAAAEPRRRRTPARSSTRRSEPWQRIAVRPNTRQRLSSDYVLQLFKLRSNNVAHRAAHRADPVRYRTGFLHLSRPNAKQRLSYQGRFSAPLTHLP